MEIILDEGYAWKLLTKGLRVEEAKAAVTINGLQTLGESFLSMICVMA